MKVVWSPLAIDRAGEIAEYIAQDNRIEAANWIDKVFTKVERLKTFPESGRVVSEINNPKIKELIHGNYRIIYRIEEKQISILTIRHGKQVLPTNEIMS